MKVELPEFKRCCCCLPLRYGLIGAGYIKLVFSLLVLASTSYNVVIYSMVQIRHGMSPFVPHLVIAAVLSLFLLIDISMTIVFLIGGHTKSVKLLNIFYIYSIVMLCIVMFLIAVSTGFELYYMTYYATDDAIGHITFSFMAQADILTFFTYFGVGMYIILLVRSEINKLRNNCQFRFVNVANEAQCTMENGIKGLNNETDDLKNESDDAKNRINNDHNSAMIDDKNEIDVQINDIIDQTKYTDRNTFNYTQI